MKTYSKPTFEVVGILDDVLANISTMGSFTEDIFGENTDLAQLENQQGGIKHPAKLTWSIYI